MCSLSSTSVDGAMNRATCLRGSRDPSYRLSVDQSKASPRNSPPHAQYGQNMLRLIESKKHSLVGGVQHCVPMMPHYTSACLYLQCIPGLLCERLLRMQILSCQPPPFACVLCGGAGFFILPIHCSVTSSQVSEG